MKPRKVAFSPEARDDLLGIYDWITSAADPKTAFDYVCRIESYCQRFDVASSRGHARDDIRPGLRIVGFRRRITIAFVVDDETVTILRFFGRGRNWESDL